MNLKNLAPLLLGALFLLLLLTVTDAGAETKNPCNPCAKKMNPCNPCEGSGKKHIRPKRITDHKKLVSIGEKLWNNAKLGESGLSCMSCHADNEKLNLDSHHGEWPHNVPGMTDDIFTLTQMINYCMINPMEAKQLDPNSVEMTAMAAFYLHLVKTRAHHPCDLPCGHPCGPPKRDENPCNPFNERFKGIPPTG